MEQAERDAREVIEEEAGAVGYDIGLFAESPETVDVVARCLALGLVSSSLKRAYDSARADTAA